MYQQERFPNGKEIFHFPIWMFFVVLQMENDEFLQALASTSKEIRIRLLQNLSDRLIGVIAETLQNVQGNVDDISEAQRKMLNIINDINVRQ